MALVNVRNLLLFPMLFCLLTLLVNGKGTISDIFEAIAKNETAVANLLLTDNPGLILQTNENKETPLHASIDLGIFAIAETLLNGLLSKHVKPLFRMKDKNGRTVVHALAMQCIEANDDFVERMAPYFHLAENVLTDEDGNTPLELAVERNCIRLVRKFLETTSCRHFNKQGYTPLHTAKRLGLYGLANVMVATGKCSLDQIDACNITVDAVSNNRKDRCEPLPSAFIPSGGNQMSRGDEIPLFCIGSKIPLPFAIQGSDKIECGTDGKWRLVDENSEVQLKTGGNVLSDDLQMAIDRRVATMMEEVRASLVQLNHAASKQAITAADNSIPVGTVLSFAGERIPDGWLLCDGRSLHGDEYKELHAEIGNKFATSSQARQFELPDLRGRTVIGAGQGGALAQRNLGSYLGAEKNTLTIEEMPSHGHPVVDHGHTHLVNIKGEWFADGSVPPPSIRYDRQAQYWRTLYLPSEYRTTNSTTDILLQQTGSSQGHNNMQPSAVLNFIIKSGTYTPMAIALPDVSPWPRTQTLLGFWALNAHYDNQDVTKNQCDGASVSSTTTIGPFGDADTARSPENDSSPVLTVPNAKLPLSSSFTVSLFLRLGSGGTQKEGGIFEFLDTFGTPNAFQLRYINTSTIEVSANGNLIGRYEMLQQKGVWTFIAMVFDNSTSKFTVYGKHGVIAPPTSQPHIFASNSFNNNGIRLGYATRWKQDLMKTDAVSCLAVHSAVLNASEIRQIQDACRIIHGTAPGGAPKVPKLSPFPVATSISRIPKIGQFPYIASLRLNSRHICSASVIDEYWLLTSARCFAESRDPSLFSVLVGEHDLSVSETNERNHYCAKIIESEDGLIGLVQVAEPIDFSNPFVNNAHLFRKENEAEIQFEASHFVFGWGKNGRRPNTPDSLGRYVPGVLLTEAECRVAWGENEYNPMNDFCLLTSSNAPCSGDEGSPLLAQAPSDPVTGMGDRLVQIGVFYKRDANCSLMKPPLFASVAKYSTWISETIACAVPGVVYPGKCPQIF